MVSRSDFFRSGDLSQALSLAGAAILSAGLSRDSGILSEPCLVLRPIASQQVPEKQMRGLGYGG